MLQATEKTGVISLGTRLTCIASSIKYQGLDNGYVGYVGIVTCTAIGRHTVDTQT